MSKSDELEDRLIDFSVRVIRLCDALPNTVTGKHIRGQLVRSGTAPAPNYAEARGAESKKDFIHKLRIALKELNEARVWIKTIIRSELVPKEKMEPLLTECEELGKILGASIQTAKK